MKYYGIVIDEVLIFVFVLAILMVGLCIYYNIRLAIKDYKIDKLQDKLKDKKKHKNYVKHLKRRK